MLPGYFVGRVHQHLDWKNILPDSMGDMVLDSAEDISLLPNNHPGCNFVEEEAHHMVLVENSLVLLVHILVPVEDTLHRVGRGRVRKGLR